MVQEAATTVNNVFLVLATSLAYCCLTIITTTDDKLVPNQATAPLPLIQTSVPITNFFLFAPIALIVVFGYLQLNLISFFRAASRLPSTFPDGTPLPEKISQWALSALLRHWQAGSSDSAGPMARGASWAAVTLLWVATPLVVLLLWVRYLPCHDRAGNLLLAALVLVTFAVAVLSFGATRREFCFELPRPFFQQGKTKKIAAMMCTVVLIGTASIDTAGGGWLCMLLPARADFADREVSSRPEKWDEKNPKEVRGAKLAEKNLAYANAGRAFLAHADFHDSWLNRANLRESNLRGADFSSAHFLDRNREDDICKPEYLGDTFPLFQRAHMELAQFSDHAMLCAVSFAFADLTDVRLEDATLTHADFTYANLTRTHLRLADLRYARFDYATLVDTDFSGADLTCAEAKGAIINNVNATKATLAGLKNGSGALVADGLAQPPCDVPGPKD
jgi:uncharacterized protein YjbI with pentapeptide repeats